MTFSWCWFLLGRDGRAFSRIEWLQIFLKRSGYHQQLNSKLYALASITRANKQLNQILSNLESKSNISFCEFIQAAKTFYAFFEYIYFASNEFIVECEGAYDSEN